MKKNILSVVFISFILFSINCGNNNELANNTSESSVTDSSKKWMMYKNPQDAGFDTLALQKIRDYYKTSDLAALFVVYKGNVLMALGDYQRRFLCHSIRKSLVNSLYGIYVDRGIIDLDKSLDQLGIDDVSPLTAMEKQATIRHLLQSRSGIYHPAVYETSSMKKSKPERGNFQPGEHWYYNNWDFNALNTIFYQITSRDILQAFKDELAVVIDLEDFRWIDSHYFQDSTVSEHPACSFKMSARDLARFGLLYRQGGIWNGKKILSQEWIKESTRSYSETNSIRGGYGYLWWIPTLADSLHGFAACGVGTQVLLMVKELDLIIVQRVNTYIGKRHNFDLSLYRKIIQAKDRPAKPSSELIQLPEKSPSNYHVKDRDKYKGNYQFTDGIYSVKNYEEGLIIEYPKGLRSRLIQISHKRFKVEDVKEIIELTKIDNTETGRLVLIDVQE